MDIDKQLIKRLRADAQKLQPTVIVGKNGINDATIAELERHLKQDKLVKVRLLKSATYEAGLDAQADALAKASNSRLIETRGATAVYYRP